MQPDDEQWRRPEPSGSSYPGVPTSSGRPRYAGPPISAPPPTGWRPTHIVEPSPPRRLPEQDHTGIDAEEARARTFTNTVGIAGGLVLIVVLIVLCGRVLF